MPATISPTSINTLRGDVTLAAGAGTSIDPSGNTLTISSNAGKPVAKNNTCVTIGTSISGALNSYYECLMLLAGGRLKRYQNGGLNGMNASYIAEHMYNNALNIKPGIAITTPMFNGIGTFSSNQEAAKRIIDSIRRSGALCVITTEPTQGGIANIGYNAWLKTYVASLNDPGTIVSDLAAVLFQSGGTGDYIGHVQTTATNTATSSGVVAVFTVADPTGIEVGMGMGEWQWVQAVSGNQITVSSSVGGISAHASPVTVDFWKYMQNSVHPGTVGSVAIAQQLLTDMENAGFILPAAQYIPLDNIDVGNLISNGTFEGTVTNGLGAGWSSDLGTPQLSVVTDPNFRGKVQQISIAPGAFTGSYLNGPGVNLRAYRGRKIALSFKMSASGVQTSGAYYSLRFGVDQSSGKYPIYSGASSNVTGSPLYFPQADFEGEGMVWYGEVVVGDNATSASFSLQIFYMTATAPQNLIIKIGEISVIDITDPLYSPVRRLESVDTISSNTTLDTTYETVLVDATGGARSVTLPAASGLKGKKYVIKKTDASANAVTIVGTVDGATNPTLTTQFACKVIEGDGTAWYTLSQYLT